MQFLFRFSIRQRKNKPMTNSTVDSTEMFLYLTTIGRKSGNPHRIEIWFTQHEGRHYILSGGREKSQWVKNILVNPSVRFSIGKRDDNNADICERETSARVIVDSAESDLAAAVRAKMQAKYAWSDGLIVEVI
jgi:deazaflavin-dependent oxidoreductase (nitroreductase family)